MAGDGDQRHLSCRVQACFHHPVSVLHTLQQPDYADYRFDFAIPFDSAFAKPSHNSMNLGLNFSKIATSGSGSERKAWEEKVNAFLVHLHTKPHKCE